MAAIRTRMAPTDLSTLSAAFHEELTVTSFDKLTIEEMYQVYTEYSAARDRCAPKHERQKLLNLWSSRIEGLPSDYRPLARVIWKSYKASEQGASGDDLKEMVDTEIENMKLPYEDIKRQWEVLFKEPLEC